MKKLLLILILIISFLLLVINENININAKILILDNKDEELAYINNGNITSSVDIDEINPKYISYIIEIEDKSFYKHNGLDIKRIFSSIYYKITNNYNSGASTITQQYIKNTYLNNNRTIKRKLKEMALAIRLESTMSKKEILEGYLSSIYFGNNVYGLKYACKYYFNKDKIIANTAAKVQSPKIYDKEIIRLEINEVVSMINTVESGDGLTGRQKAYR